MVSVQDCKIIADEICDDSAGGSRYGEDPVLAPPSMTCKYVQRQQCTTEEKELCEDVLKTACDKEDRQVCNIKHVQNCVEEPKQVCQIKEREECKITIIENCVNEPRQKCRDK